jgi:large subunit ribosomal protein L4
MASPKAPVLGGTKKVDLPEEVFTAPFNGPLVHEVVTAELAARRQGTAATKSRGMVSGGNSKPWRQKGTGRARVGSSRNPVWTGGGHAFALVPRHYTSKVNRKARRAALRSALSVHADRGSIAVLDTAPFETPSTKQAVGLLEGRLGGSVLVLLGSDEITPARSFRNLKTVTVLEESSAGVADIVGAATLVVSQSALDGLAARAAKKDARGTAEITAGERSSGEDEKTEGAAA